MAIAFLSISFFIKQVKAIDVEDFQDNFQNKKIIDITNLKNYNKSKLNEDLETALKNYKPSKENETIKSKEKVKKYSNKKPQTISNELILNNGFESGHASWDEYISPRNSDILEYNEIISYNPSTSANGNWHALLVADYDYSTVLYSNYFNLPNHSSSLTLNYNGVFIKSGTCLSGLNTADAVIWDATNREIAEIINLNNANTEQSDDQYYNYEFNTTSNLSNRERHSMFIFFVFHISDENCESGLFLDDVSLTATITSSPSTSIHRFWSNSKQGHFFTISSAEKDFIIANDSSWTYEGEAFSSFPTQESNTSPIYRFWSNSKQHHFFTVSEAEKDFIIANDSSWSYEGIAYYAYATEQSGSTPVYRFWSNAKQGHFFTISAAEKDSIIANDHSWSYEGIAWYVPTN